MANFAGWIARKIPLAVADGVALCPCLPGPTPRLTITSDVTANEECHAIGWVSQLTNSCRNDLLKLLVPKLPETI